MVSCLHFSSCILLMKGKEQLLYLMLGRKQKSFAYLRNPFYWDARRLKDSNPGWQEVKEGDRGKHENYQGISLLNAAYTVYGKIQNKRLCTIPDVLMLEEQSEFCRLYLTWISFLCQIIEKQRIKFVDTPRLDWLH